MFETWPTPSPACMAKHNNRLAVRDGAPSRRNGINRHQSVVALGIPTTLTAQRLALTAQRLALTAQRLALTAQRLALTAQRLALTAQRLALTAQRLALTAQRLALTAQRLALTAQRLAFPPLRTCIGRQICSRGSSQVILPQTATPLPVPSSETGLTLSTDVCSRLLRPAKVLCAPGVVPLASKEADWLVVRVADGAGAAPAAWKATGSLSWKPRSLRQASRGQIEWLKMRVADGAGAAPAA
eukprot:1160983-Pelagomonas_calceolata.AAC.3